MIVVAQAEQLLPAEAGVSRDRVTGLLDHRVRGELGWQPQRQRFLFPKDHPAIVPRRCRTAECDASAGTAQGLCITCNKLMTRGRVGIDEFIAIPRQWVNWTDTMCLVCRTEGHERPARTYGLCESCRSQMKARGQSVEAFVSGDDRFPPATPRRSHGYCRVDSCDRLACHTQPRLCFGHDERWRKAGSPDLKVFTSSTEPLKGDLTNGAWLGGLAPLVVNQLLFGVQRCIARGRQLRPSDLNVLCVALRDMGAADLAVARPPTKAGRRFIDFTLGELAVAVANPESELRRDVWHLQVWRPGETQTLDFGDIPQPWLRDAVKQWLGHGLAMDLSTGTLVARVRFATRLAQHLHRVTPAATPAWLNQTARERYLAELKLDEAAGRLSPYSRHRVVLLFRQFVHDANTMGLCDRGQPLAGMAPSFNVGPDEVPSRQSAGDPDDEVGRGLPEVIIAQLLAPANLELLGPMWQRLVRLAIDTGRRPDELCRLRFHCLDEDLAVDADGNQQRHPVLVHDQPKTRRRGVRLPIAESTAAVIKDQQDAVVAEYHDTPTDRLALFPCRQWNAHGERATSPSSLAPVIIEWRRRLQLYDAVFRDGHLEPLLGAGGQPVPFPSDAVFAYAFRHTYAQRHIDANVGLEMLASLMGHTNLNTTGAYYRIRTQQKREALAKVTQYQLSVRGGVTSSPRTASHALRLELGSISTPMGTCVEPSNVKAIGRACPFRHRCFGCAHFRTDISHLPELRAYLHQLLLAREELADANIDIAEWARKDAMPSDEEIDSVRRLIDGCEALLDQLPDDERQELMRHIETLREGRQHLADAVPVALTAKVLQSTPTVFPALHLVKDLG
jgi:integrase